MGLADEYLYTGTVVLHNVLCKLNTMAILANLKRRGYLIDFYG